ncbi:MAG: type II secretion system protein GspD [Limisphaerales bacterium]
MKSPSASHGLLLVLGLGLSLAMAASAATTPNTRRSKARAERSATSKGAMRLTESPPEPSATVPLPPPTPVSLVHNAVVIPETPLTDPVPSPGVAVRITPSPTPDIATQIQGRKLYSFHAVDLELKAALALFARANGLNIVPDHDVTGQVTLDVQDLPLERLMQALLEAHDYSWSSEDGLIRVRAKESREFWIDYLRLSRKGMGSSSATLASGMSGGGGGGGGGGGSSGGSSVNLTADNAVNFWVELKEELVRLLTPAGRDSIAINMTAGVLQISDRPSALKRVTRYLENLSGSVARQVEIQARIFDVTLKDQFQFGIDWGHAAEAFGGVATMGGSTIVTAPIGGATIRDSAFSFLFKNENTQVLLEALEEQGEVNVVSQPRIRVINNQTAMIKVGTETPFFTSRTTTIPGTTAGTTTQLQEDAVQTITIGTILAITPQISSNDWVTLDVAPVLTSLVETRTSPSEATTAPVLDIKQASTLVRVRSGTTVVLGGLMQDEHGKTTKKIPVIGDIPLLGYLFRGTVDYTAKKELVISITPTIVEE